MKNDEDFFPIKGVRMNYEILFCWNMILLHNQQIHQLYLFESFFKKDTKISMRRKPCFYPKKVEFTKNFILWKNYRIEKSKYIINAYWKIKAFLYFHVFLILRYYTNVQNKFMHTYSEKIEVKDEIRNSE